MSGRMSTRRTNRSTAWALGAGAALLAIAGCSKPLLGPRDERTPYDRYDNVRGQYAPQYIENEYGRREPNLRGRLSPRD